MENSTIGDLVWFLFIGGVVGWLAGLITRGRGFGIIGDIVVGIVGAMLGGWMARVIGVSTVVRLAPFCWRSWARWF